jgi:DNA polymerase III gamma/tau subunit
METTVRLVESLADGRVADGLALVRDQLAGGQDASVLYHEVGRVLRAALYVAVDPELAPPMSDAHRDLLTALVENVGGDGLGRMLGLWMEQEAMVRGAANRELALEVASLRLARWPSVRRVEEWLAGTVESGHGPVDSSSGSGAPRSSQGSPAASGGATPSEARGQEPAPPKAADNDHSLAEEAGSDPGVILATKILGGEVVRVRPDGDGS